MKSGAEIEAALRSALRRQPPAAELGPRVLARINAEPARPPRRPRWLAAAVAACLLLVSLAGVARWRQQAEARRQATARADARQLAFALRVAATDLDRVQRQIAGSAAR